MDTSKGTTRRFVVPHAVLATASHELRGPLGVARGHLRLLSQNEGLDPGAVKAIGDASRALDRMTGLLDELSRYAQWARGESVIAPARASLREVLTQAAARAVSVAGADGALSVEVQSSADVTAEVDVQRLAEACGSLVVAVARANAKAPGVSLAVAGTSRGATLRIEPLPMVQRRLEARPPDLGRGGMGLAVPFADLVIRAHRGVLTELWSADTWYGYRVRLEGADSGQLGF